MARTGRRGETASQPNALVASASRYFGKSDRQEPTITLGQDIEWQRDCYRHYRICGEATYAANYIATAFSRAKIGLSSESEAAQSALEDLFTPENMRRMGLHATVAGEFYVIGRSPQAWELSENPSLDAEQDIWEVLSVREVQRTGSEWTINYQDGRLPIELEEDDPVIRVWMSDPEYSRRAFSPFRPLIPVLEEIEGATKVLKAQQNSRLVANGILFLAEGIQLPPAPGKKEPNTAESVVHALMQAAQLARKNLEAPESQIPIVVTVPDELVSASNHLTLWTEADEKTQENREAAIRRFALGMDLPPEKVLGISGQVDGQERGSNHWNVWAIDEDAITMHIEPLLDSLLAILTNYYLYPLVEEDIRFTYDLTRLRLRPDRSKESIELQQMGALKLVRMLEENGFTADDMPDKEEMKNFLLMRIATGSATPEQVNAALVELGVDLGIDFTDPEVSEVSETPQLPPPVSIRDHPTRPSTPAERDAASLIACEGLVLRALERAGNKTIQKNSSRQSKITGIDPTRAHVSFTVNGEGPALLEGGFLYADTILEGTGLEPEIVNVLSDYCLELFASKEPHSRAKMADFLEKRLANA